MFAMSYEGIYCSTVILLTSEITNSKQKEQNIIMKLAFLSTGLHSACHPYKS